MKFLEHNQELCLVQEKTIYIGGGCFRNLNKREKIFNNETIRRISCIQKNELCILTIFL